MGLFKSVINIWKIFKFGWRNRKALMDSLEEISDAVESVKITIQTIRVSLIDGSMSQSEMISILEAKKKVLDEVTQLLSQLEKLKF